MRFFFYKVCPFEAVFSAFWFQRVSGFLVRVLRQLFWVRHALLMYADDLPSQQVIDLLASWRCAFAKFSAIPWHGGSTIAWVGWQFNFLAAG